MIYIKKQKEPSSLREHRSTPGANFNSLDKTELRKSLLEEQGYLCAYCMRRISGDKDVKIEHYRARNIQNEMEYVNLLAVCTGNETMKNSGGKVDPDKFTCDTKKKNKELHINPQNRLDMESIYYDNQGNIYSKNPVYQEDFDYILNLNDRFGFLINNRKNALAAVIKELRKLKPGQNAMPLLRRLEKWSIQKNKSGEYPEYAGIIRWYIEKQIKKHS